MKTLKSFLIGLTLLISVDYSFSQGIPSEIVSFSETENSFIIDFNLPDYLIVDTNLYSVYGLNQNYKYINVNSENFGVTWDVGYPCLPQLTINLSVPKGSTGFTVSSSNINSDTITINYLLFPSQEDIKDTILFTINQQFYNSNGSSYSFTSLLSDPYIVMGKDGISLRIFPFQYNPLSNSISVINSATYTVSFIPPPIPQDTILPEIKELFIEKFYQNFKKSEIKNGSSPTYLIITPQRFENTLTFFANYKRNIGFDVTVVNTVTTGTSKDNIKDYINNFNPMFVLLVGDIADIPAYGTMDGSEDYDPTTDLDYTLLEGNDFFPDVFLGRMPVSTEAELQNILNKTIFMETNMYRLGNNAKFLAGWHLKNNGEPNEWYCKRFEEGHNYAIDNSFFAYNNEKIYAWSLDHTRNDALNALNDNPIFFVYSGHGSHTSLGSPFSISSSDVTLRSHITYPFAFSFACRTGNFGFGTCYGESWIRSPQGGISYFGCSVPSLVEPDVKLEKSILSPIGRLGPMVDIGKMQFWLLYHTVLNNARWKRYMKSYNLFGDPSFFINGIGCINEFIFSNNEVFNNGDSITYHATDRIIAAEGSSTFVVESGADVTLKAGNSITLKPGFHAKAGSNFHAYIEPCTKGTQKNLSITENTYSDINQHDTQYQEKIKRVYNTKAFPNPFTNVFTIEYTLSVASEVEINLFNTSGKKLFSTIFTKEAGNNSFNFNDMSLSSGLYLLKIKTEEYVEVIMLLKTN